MPDVRIKLPEGVEVDKTRLTSAVRFAIDGGTPDKIWRMNNVPAIAQLEEATYVEGRQDLALLYYEVTTGLDLPDHEAQAVLAKALQQFEEQQHPREAAGEAMAGYKPGEFVPKDTGTPAPAAPAAAAEPAVADDAEIARLRQGADERIASIAKLMKMSGAEKKVELQGRIDRIRQEVEEEIAAHQAGAPVEEKKPKTAPLVRHEHNLAVGDGLTRTGGRPLPEEVTREGMRDQFGFKAAMGHDLKRDELRRFHAEGSTGAFMDLADALGLEDREIGLSENLTYDVRSAGWTAFCSYEEPTRTLVIKSTDGGCVAHEWWHAIDNGLGRQMVVGASPETMASEARRRDMKDADHPVADALRNLMETVNRSQFFQTAHALDKKSGNQNYWNNAPEMTARAFETYVEDKLAERGQKNTYLCDTRRGIPQQYPQGEDRTLISAAFDGLWEAIRQNRTMLKALASILTDDEGEAVADDLAKAFGFPRKVKVAPGQVALDFEEDDHPREKAGETLPGYKPGEFIPKGAQGQAGDEPSDKKEAPLPSYEDQLSELQDRYTKANQALEKKRANLRAQQEATDDPEEKARLHEDILYLLDEQGVGFQRFRNQVSRFQALMADGEPMPDWDERRGQARKLMEEYRELGRQFVAMSDPHRAELHAKSKAMFLQADRAEGMTPTYLKRQALLAAIDAGNQRRPFTQQIIDATDDNVRADLLAKVEEISEAGVMRENEFLNRAEWIEEDDKAQIEANLRELLGEKEYNRRKDEEAQAEAYKKAHPRTDYGYDRRQVTDPKAHDRSWKARWKGEQSLTDEECERRGVPKGTKHLRPEAEKEALTVTLIGGDTAYYGPANDPAFRKECDAMRGRVNKAFPQWMRDHLAAKGVTQNYCAASPSRTQFANQREFYDWLKDNPQLANKANPDLGGGIFYPSKKAAFTQVGNSFPGESARTASLCVEIHEYAHALDYNFRQNGEPIHKLDEWHQILSDLHVHLDWYNQKPQELFAEGLTAFLHSPKARKQMLQGPPQWRRMGKFFQTLMDADKGWEMVKKSLTEVAAPEGGEGLDTTEEVGAGDDKQKLPAGFVWKPGMMVPAPDGNGFMIVDGYGPDEGH
jgi:hypothetical protein